jgi:hypothetical protein
MSRPSSAALAVVQMPSRPREQPTDLPAAQAQVWDEIVGKMPPGHFTPADDALLLTFVQVTVRLREAERQIGKRMMVKGKMSPWLVAFEKLSRMQTALARALRIATNARVDPTKAGKLARGKPQGQPGPWKETR